MDKQNNINKMEASIGGLFEFKISLPLTIQNRILQHTNLRYVYFIFL